MTAARAPLSLDEGVAGVEIGPVGVDLILGLAVAGIVLAGAEAAFFHGRTRFFHPAMFVPPAYALLALWLGSWHLADPEAPLPREALYYLLGVGVLVGLAGETFHLRRAARALRSTPKGRYRTLSVGAPLSLPLLFLLFGLMGIVAFHLP